MGKLIETCSCKDGQRVRIKMCDGCGGLLVYDDNLVEQISVMYEQIEKFAMLLKTAKCPQADCDGEGTCSRMGPGYDGEGDIDVYQCQWCHERKLLLEESEG